MSESQVLYLARQVTEALDCSPQMAGKYFQALEKITKTKIKTHGRDGRQFDSSTRDVLVSARNIVRSQHGVTVEDAVRRALSLSQIPVEEELTTNTHGLQAQQLIDALRASQEPLLNELREIKLEIQSLRAENQELAALWAANTAQKEDWQLDSGTPMDNPDVEPAVNIRQRLANYFEGLVVWLRN